MCEEVLSWDLSFTTRRSDAFPVPTVNNTMEWVICPLPNYILLFVFTASDGSWKVTRSLLVSDGSPESSVDPRQCRTAVRVSACWSSRASSNASPQKLSGAKEPNCFHVKAYVILNWCVCYCLFSWNAIKHITQFKTSRNGLKFCQTAEQQGNTGQHVQWSHVLYKVLLINHIIVYTLLLLFIYLIMH